LFWHIRRQHIGCIHKVNRLAVWLVRIKPHNLGNNCLELELRAVVKDLNVPTLALGFELHFFAGHLLATQIEPLPHRNSSLLIGRYPNVREWAEYPIHYTPGA